MTNNSLNYPEIIKKLSRYPFPEKENIIRNLSVSALRFFYQNEIANSSRTYVYPWLIDSYATYCLLSTDNTWNKNKKYGSKECKRETDSIIDSIWSVLPPPSFGQPSSTVLHSIVPQEIPYQLDRKILAFRYYYLIEYSPEIKTSFELKTHCKSYMELASLIWLAESIAIINGTNSFKLSLLDKACDQYKDELSFISKTRKEICECQEQCITDKTNSDLAYSAKVISLFPILKDGSNCLLLLPHALSYALTDNLFISLTSGDVHLREKFGKMLEKYLYSIIKESENYDKVMDASQRHTIKKGMQKDPPDITVFKDGYLIFFESKILSPRTKSRLNEQNALNSEVNNLIEAIQEVSRQYIFFKQGFFKPFGLVSDNVKDVFLVVSTLYASGLFASKLIDQALSTPEFSEYKSFLQSHILVCGIDLIETYCLFKSSMLPVLIEQQKTGTLENTTTNKQSDEKIESYQKFNSICCFRAQLLLEYLLKKYN
jgi:hypothetical protein